MVCTERRPHTNAIDRLLGFTRYTTCDAKVRSTAMLGRSHPYLYLSADTDVASSRSSAPNLQRALQRSGASEEQAELPRQLRGVLVVEPQLK